MDNQWNVSFIIYVAAADMMPFYSLGSCRMNITLNVSDNYNNFIKKMLFLIHAQVVVEWLELFTNAIMTTLESFLILMDVIGSTYTMENKMVWLYNYTA